MGYASCFKLTLAGRDIPIERQLFLIEIQWEMIIERWYIFWEKPSRLLGSDYLNKDAFLNLFDIRKIHEILD